MTQIDVYPSRDLKSSYWLFGIHGNLIPIRSFDFLDSYFPYIIPKK